MSTRPRYLKIGTVDYGNPMASVLIWNYRGRSAVTREQVEREAERAALLYAAAMRGEMAGANADDKHTNH